MQSMVSEFAQRVLATMAVVCAAVILTGCLIATTPPPGVGPGVEAVPAASIKAREIVVIEQLRVLKKGEDIYSATHNRYATMDELIKAGAINTSPQGLGYTIDLTLTDDGYTIIAVPNEYGPNGKRSFYVDQTGVIRGDDHMGGAAAADDPVAN